MIVCLTSARVAHTASLQLCGATCTSTRQLGSGIGKLAFRDLSHAAGGDPLYQLVGSKNLVHCLLYPVFYTLLLDRVRAMRDRLGYALIYMRSCLHTFIVISAHGYFSC